MSLAGDAAVNAGDDEPPSGDVPLTGGRMSTGVVRRGDYVVRPTGLWAPAVHEYLRHLETAGFAGAPRFVGHDGDQEILTYLEGDVPVDPEWEPGRGIRLPDYARTDAALTAAARLLRELHDAAAGFRPACVEYRFHPHPPRPGEVVSHGDLGPWNTVYRAGLPVAFIDWDAAQPVDPIVDLAAAAWAYVPLAAAEQLAESGFDPLPDLGQRLRLFVDAYGLDDRQVILPALKDAALLAVGRVRYWPHDAADIAGALEFSARGLRWLHGIVDDLARAL